MGLSRYPSSVKWFQPLMALRTASDNDTRRGTDGAHTSRHTEPLSVPRTNSTTAQVLPNPDSLPSTKRVEQSLDTCGQDGDRKQQHLRLYHIYISFELLDLVFIQT